MKQVFFILLIMCSAFISNAQFDHDNPIVEDSYNDGYTNGYNTAQNYICSLTPISYSEWTPTHEAQLDIYARDIDLLLDSQLPSMLYSPKYKAGYIKGFADAYSYCSKIHLLNRIASPFDHNTPGGGASQNGFDAAKAEYDATSRLNKLIEGFRNKFGVNNSI